MNFEFDNNMPIYVQLVEQIKNHIISGELGAGEKLPSVRELALLTKVNPNTMQKALAELEETRLIFTERTNGKFVTTDENLIAAYKNELADSVTKKYLAQMKKLGFSSDQTFEYIKKMKGNE